MFGRSANQAIGESIEQFIPQRFQDSHQKHVKSFGETQVTDRRMGALGAISGLRANGEEFPIEASISQVKRGEQRFFTVILRDISERKKAEESLSRLGKLLDESMNEIYLFDSDTLRFTQVNQGARVNLGYSMEELSEMTPLDLMPEFTWDTFQELIRPLRDGKRENFEFTTVHRRKNGTTYPVGVHLQLSKFESGQIFVAIILDITERLKAEQALKESQRSLVTLMAHLPGMVYRCINNPEWTMEFVSDGCMELTGYRTQDLIGNKKVSYGHDLIHPDDQQRVWEGVQEAIRERKSFQLNYRITTPQESQKWVWEQGSGVYSPDGEVIAIEGFISDITGQKLMEERLRQTERLAEMGTLASGMAHEIGTPMNVILGRAEYLMRKTSDESTKKGLATIVTQVERITKIMNQLLSFARKEGE